MFKQLMLVCMISSLVHAKTIYIVPFGPTFAGESLFNPEERDGTLLPFCALREATAKLGYEIKAVFNINNLINPAAIVFLNSHNEVHFMKALHRYHCPKILYLWEPPLHDAVAYNRSYHQHFNKVFSLSSDQVDNKRVYKWVYPQPVLEMLGSIPDYDQKKLCTMMIGNHYSNHPQEIYSERLRAIQFFSRYGPEVFEFYGGGWPAHQYPCYRGTVPRKVDCLKHYRFSICYENTRDLPGYLTEKIFDCMIAGCVPVYWGDPEITRYIPANCFIDRRSFNSLEELYAYLSSMSRDTYEQYLNNIRNFLASSSAHRFSIDAFIDIFLSAIDSAYDRSRIFSLEQCQRLGY